MLKLPGYFYDYIVKSVVDTLKTYGRWRPNGMRLLIFVQLAIYACYKLSNANFKVTYLYMKL